MVFNITLTELPHRSVGAIIITSRCKRCKNKEQFIIQHLAFQINEDGIQILNFKGHILFLILRP